MDKSCAWVSLIPTFGIYFISGVLQFASGLIRQTLLQNEGNRGLHYITWISSVYSGSYNLLGPLSSVMVYRMGCRKTVLIGATLETLGLIGSFFVVDSRHFLFTYSLLSGMGAGISYPPVGVLLGYNFDRYLPIASGLAVSGVGIGFIVMPLLTHFLLNCYGLQGTFLVMAGLTLQKWVFGALMRPSAVELDQLKKFQKSGMVLQGEKSGMVLQGEKSGMILQGVKSGMVLQGEKSGMVLQGEKSGMVLQGEKSGMVLQGEKSGMVLQGEKSGMVLQGVKSGMVLQGEKSGMVLQGEKSGMVLQGEKSGMVLQGDKSGMVLQGEKSGMVLQGEKSGMVLQGEKSGMVLQGEKSGMVLQGEKSKNLPTSNELQPSKASTVQVDTRQEIPSDLSTYVPRDSAEKENRNIVLVSSQIQAKKRPTNNMVGICITADDVTGSHEKGDDKMATIYNQAEEKTFKCRTDQNKTTDNCKTVDNCTLKSRPSEIKMTDTFSKINSPKNNNSCNLDKDLANAAKGSNIKYNPCIDVVKNTKFLLLLFCIFCFTVSETLVYLVIPTYFASKGSTESEISYLFSILGIFSMLTRPLMGFLANSKTVDISILFSAPFGILGVITFILPLMAHIFVGRICFIVAFALYNCSVYSLLNQMLVQICGLDNLSAAFGFMMLAKGIATTFGPPITVTVTHSADSVFLVAGFMYEVCSLAALFLMSGKSSSETDTGNLQLEEK